ncbi:hypothetical protein [Nocardioides sp. JQ2195]|uniref:hypothetical protein n=1 Tax=Nocardioides sp. JQ2195 TaxID=2592334 RepID=UPI0019806A0B|nr:hypothetical protein [Nocardioides sp. JQ2195]
MNFQRVVAGCMKMYGFNYAAAAPRPQSVEPASLPVEESTAGSDVTFRETKSMQYKMPTRQAPASIVAGPSSAYYQALRGVTIPSGLGSKALNAYDWRAYDGVNSDNFGISAEDTGGCEAEGRELVSEPALLALEELQIQAAPLVEAIGTDPIYEGLQADWIDCMADQDYNYSSPIEPATTAAVEASDLYEAGGTAGQWATLEAAEEDLAETTADCLTTTGYQAYLDGLSTQPEWLQFVTDNQELLDLAGGRTLAVGGNQ